MPAKSATWPEYALICGNLPAQFEILPHLSVKCSGYRFSVYSNPLLFYAQPGAISRTSITKGTTPVRITSSLLAVAGLLGLFIPVSALAQTQQPAAGQKAFGPRIKAGQAGQAGQPAAAAAAEIVATHGAWQIQCGTAPAEAGGGQAGKKSCGMVQITRSEKNAKVGLSLVIVKTKQADKDVIMMRVLAPIGVYLPTGVALEIDGAAVGRVPFTRCRPQICEALAEASAETLAKMKKGTAANFIVYEAPGLGIPMKISLDGFSAALDNLNTL